MSSKGLGNTADDSFLQFLLPGVPNTSGTPPKTAPAILRDISRSASGIADPFINDTVIRVEAVHELPAPSRSGDAGKVTTRANTKQLLALEADDGTTLFIRADKLQTDLQRLYPSDYQTGVIDFSKLTDPASTSRGLSDWVWAKLSVLNIAPDELIEQAKTEVLQLAKDTLGDKLSKTFRDDLEENLSWLGAKALMGAIEGRLGGGEPGLYRWRGQKIDSADRITSSEAACWANIGQETAPPILLFIHGTASSTLGSFKDLAASNSQKMWGSLQRQFGEHIYGFEHRTFSESPIENALQLANSLPKGARLSVVTHSRGGLVGDLLCMDALSKELIQRYRRRPLPNTKETSEQKALRERRDELDQIQLRELSDLLVSKQFQIERYVRVACPAGGTTLLSDNLDLFLSSLLSLTNMLIGSFTGGLGNFMLSAFKRIVLEIASKRIDAHAIPGIEAMLTDAPMGALLANAPRRPHVKMAVISGDIDGGSMLKRMALIFTDWMFFNKIKNDLVVDTRSMYAGQARHPETYALFDRGHEVSHFSYFRNPYTRQALDEWLAGNAPEQTAFEPLKDVQERERQERSAKPRLSAPSGQRPVVIYLPGIMGSHLEIPNSGQRTAGEGNRVWLDVLELGLGGLGRISIDQSVAPEGIVDMFYGKLADFLGETHDVIPFPYDWRNPIEDAAQRLESKLKSILAAAPKQPVHLLAHSMGGLVVRAMLARPQPAGQDLWEEVVKRKGRFIMLGTPNNGSHAMLGTLLGRAGSIRKLAMLDFSRSLQDILDIVGAFPGALQLLPRPGFTDANGGTDFQYFEPETWGKLKKHNRDRWFGDHASAQPDKKSLDSARQVWANLLCNTDGKPRALPHPEHIAYVYGKASQTDCGIKLENERLYMRATDCGDGSVTWKSGKLDWLPEERHWYMPVNHGLLTHSPQYFPAIRELLDTGSTTKLERTAPINRGSETIRSYDVTPEPYPSAEAFMLSIYGGEPEYQAATDKMLRLEVSVQAMDLRFAQLPVMCGHYMADTISGSELQVDEYIVNGALSQRERLDVYADEVGTSTVVLNKRTEEEIQRGTGKGAVIIGLGDWSKISTQRITEGVSDGVLNFLLHHLELNAGQEDSLPPAALALGLDSLLIGYNSTNHISVESSIDAIVRGVCEANQRFARNTDSKLRVGKLEFIEIYRDTAITAAYAVRELPLRLKKDFERYQVQVIAEPHMHVCKGVRPRLGVTPASGYWPRLMVTDTRTPEDADLKAGIPPKSFKYVFLSERARAEEIAQQRQPGLIETLVESSLRYSRYDADASRTLFQLMVPLHFKAMARQTERLLLVVDAYTANLPWEMLQADDEPLVIRVSMIRQLVSMRFRRVVSSTVQRTACVIGNPSTAGYQGAFNPTAPDPHNGLPSLPGAVKEARIIHEILEMTPQQYAVEALYPPGETGEPCHSAQMVFNTLFKYPYRILAIAAHGVVEAEHKDGQKRTGVVLSDGLLLTAAEIRQMEVVPELVFLNCCHLGVMNNEPVNTGVRYNRLAYSLAQELIEMGVRCVVAAGWAVNDAAAYVFAKTFFSAFVNDQKAFGVAVQQARLATWEHDRMCNTWGAYQAYGDPTYVLDDDGNQRNADNHWNPVSPDELLARLGKLQADANHRKHKAFSDAHTKIETLLRQAPPEWQKLATVQFALGSLYAEYAPDGFTLAQQAYRNAISAEDTSGQVPVQALEQLANLETRTGEALGGAEGHDLINQAINRLTGLLEVTEGIEVMRREDGLKQVVKRGDSEPNAERWSLLGSAWKRKAVLHKRSSADWSAVEDAINHSRNAYRYANPDDAMDNPTYNLYALINRLQLDGLLAAAGHQQDGIQALQQAHRCQELARQRFARSYAFFDAVMPADAQLAIYLLEDTLADHTAQELVTLYQNAADPVPASSRQFDSVVKQLRLFAEFLALRQRNRDLASVDTLLAAAEQLTLNA